MTRAFQPRPLPPGLLDGLLALAVRAPSAGNTAGWHAVVLEGTATARFWDITLPPARRATFRWQRLLDAPAIVLPYADPQAYVARYAEPDKAATGLGTTPDAWPTPYWTVDASMATMTLLLAAEDAGLGALLFGVFQGAAELAAELGVPAHLEPIGAVALGYRAEGSGPEFGPGRSAGRARRDPSGVVHRDGW
ncbi:MAG TPA: nitroreductase family protein [Ilumatobacter sp.]|nr:nitroreductase family protein [Ilumatobacter sp.]